MMEFHVEILGVLCPGAVPACFMASLLTLAKTQKRSLCPIGAHIGGHGTRCPSSSKGSFHSKGQLHWECIFESVSKATRNVAVESSARVHPLPSFDSFADPLR